MSLWGKWVRRSRPSAERLAQSHRRRVGRQVPQQRPQKTVDDRINPAIAGRKPRTSRDEEAKEGGADECPGQHKNRAMRMIQGSEKNAGNDPADNPQQRPPMGHAFLHTRAMIVFHTTTVPKLGPKPSGCTWKADATEVREEAKER